MCREGWELKEGWDGFHDGWDGNEQNLDVLWVCQYKETIEVYRLITYES